VPFAENGVLSNTCSGTAETGGQFSQIFGQVQGSASTSAADSAFSSSSAGSSGSAGSAGDVQPVAANTNPADAPYPQWSGIVDYPIGYKIVDDGEIYQAKWYNTGDDPQAQVQYDWQTPWELLGPVLPGDHAPHIALPAGSTYNAWELGTDYQAGSKVLYDGLPYQAKWTNQGTAPQPDAGNQASSPWQPLYKIPGEPVTSPTPGV
jgi:chitinase